MEEKILITGATGRIGKHLLNALTSKGEKVRVLVKEGMVENEQAEVSYGDLLNKDSLSKAVEGVDVIYHLVAVVDYLAPKDLMFNVNVVGTKNLLEVSKAKKFIYLSSTAVMGKKLKELPANENTPCHPSNFYGETKLEAEKLVKEAGGVIIRSPDVLMPRFIEGYDFIFSKLLEGRMPIIGDGKNFIDYIHVNDLIRALLLAEEKGKNGEVYIVSGKGVKTQKEWLEIASKYLNVEPPKNHASTFSTRMFAYGSVIKHKFGGDRPEFIPEYLEKILRNRTFDTAKARNELGFESSTDLETSLKEMVEDYLERSKQQEDEITDEQGKDQSQGKN